MSWREHVYVTVARVHRRSAQSVGVVAVELHAVVHASVHERHLPVVALVWSELAQVAHHRLVVGVKHDAARHDSLLVLPLHHVAACAELVHGALLRLGREDGVAPLHLHIGRDEVECGWG